VSGLRSPPARLEESAIGKTGFVTAVSSRRIRTGFLNDVLRPAASRLK
jgi:hypothetical protein